MDARQVLHHPGLGGEGFLGLLDHGRDDDRGRLAGELVELLLGLFFDRPDLAQRVLEGCLQPLGLFFEGLFDVGWERLIGLLAQRLPVVVGHAEAQRALGAGQDEARFFGHLFGARQQRVGLGLVGGFVKQENLCWARRHTTP